MNNSYVVCDLETTGLNPQTDKIIEIGLVRLENGVITDTFQSFVKPGRALSLKIKRLTGITDDDLDGAPMLSSVLPQVWEFIDSMPIAGHSVNFDLGFLAAARGAPLNNKAYDTLELARLVAPGQRSFRLGSLCHSFGIELPGAHRALDDARATAELLIKLTDRIRCIDLQVMMRLIGLLEESGSSWHYLFSLAMQDILKAFPNRKIEERNYWQRKNKDKKNNSRRSGEAGRDTAGKTELVRKELEPDKLLSLLETGGPLSGAIPAYESRPQQKAMVQKVAEALNNDKYLLLEAGTGVGKSMAYLIPGVLWSLLNKEKVLVATHTINLQEQLLKKDIPILTEVIGKNFRAALAKGRQNYLCLRRWFNAKPQFPEEAAFYAQVQVWLSLTDNGDRAELNPDPAEEEYWLNICGEAENCLTSKCRYRNDCFINTARKAAEEADLIITNHSLLLLDIKSDNLILPEYGPLIMDEAHHLEDAATNHLSVRVSQSALRRWLNITGRILERFKRINPSSDREKWSQILKTSLITRLNVNEAARLFFQMFGEAVNIVAPKQDAAYQSGRVTLRLPMDNEQMLDAVITGKELVSSLRKFLETIRQLVAMLNVWSITSDVWTELELDLNQIYQNGLTITEEFAFILACELRDYVYWTEVVFAKDGEVRQCVLQAAPVNVGEILHEKFYKSRKTVVLTSATLSVNGTFKYFIERSGLSLLPAERLVQECYDSPFDYENQALLCVHKAMPVQGAVLLEHYLEELGDILEKLLQVTKGRTLVLFTSHMILRETYNRMQAKQENLDIFLLGHGIDGSRTRILEEFIDNDKAVLFGAASFWEGVDVKGEALTCVVMVKLPFWSPKIPVIEARLSELNKKNRNGFQEFSVPQAVMRFKQGFGRLIRSSIDRGCVVVLDTRIVDKKYGKDFLCSLPIKSHIRGDTELIVRKLADWFTQTDGNTKKISTFHQGMQ